jgi:Uma2 family endonuclease
MRVSEAEYQRFALDHPDEKWELHCGELQKKPAMTWEHNRTARTLGRLLAQQLNWEEFEVVVDMGRLRRSAEGYYIPDVYVVPREMYRRLFSQGKLEAYPEPLPLVVEVWSPSTGRYDVRVKLREYQRRGDLEIWLIHPSERTLTAWRRRPDGSYIETSVAEGAIQPAVLPGVTIAIASLFDWQ